MSGQPFIRVVQIQEGYGRAWVTDHPEMIEFTEENIRTCITDCVTGEMLVDPDRVIEEYFNEAEIDIDSGDAYFLMKILDNTVEDGVQRIHVTIQLENQEE
jgi:hypothetical protein